MKSIKRIAVVVVFTLMMLQCLSLSAYAKALSAPKKVKAEQTDEKEVTVSWRKVKGAKGYKLQYRKKGGRWISKIIKRTTKKVGKLNPGKTYQFRVRAYKKVDGKKVYGKYSSIKKVKIESGIVSNAVIHKGYTINTGNTTVYSNSGLSGKIGTIFDTDELIIHSATNTYAYVTYPISRGTKTGYIPRSAVLTQTKGKIYSAKAKITTYKRPGGNSYGYISKNDSVIVLGNKGNYTQVKYPVSGGYKLGFITTSDCINYIIKEGSDKEVISDTEIERAASKYGISKSSNAYSALNLINSKYYSKISSNTNGTNVFLFEGVGGDSNTSKHANAMCVVVKNGEIKYVNRNCTTIPDKPFNSTGHPTLEAGVYNFITVRHHPSGGISNYAALKIKTQSGGSTPVLRFKSTSKYYEDTSSAINVHARWSYSLSNNSEGCQLIGAPGFNSKNKNTYPSEYLSFCKAVGILNNSRSKMTYTTNYDNSIKGKIIIDRSFAKDYLLKVGYPSKSLSYLM